MLKYDGKRSVTEQAAIGTKGKARAREIRQPITAQQDTTEQQGKNYGPS